MYALIDTTEVIELCSINYDVPTPLFWVFIVPAHGTVEVGYSYDSVADTFSAPTHTLAEYKDALNTYTAMRKAQNVTINSDTFLTKPDNIGGMAMLLQSTMTSYSYTMADGTVEVYTQAELTARYNAIMTYQNACSANQATLITALDAATDPADVDLDVGWPSNTLTV